MNARGASGGNWGRYVSCGAPTPSPCRAQRQRQRRRWRRRARGPSGRRAQRQLALLRPRQHGKGHRGRRTRRRGRVHPRVCAGERGHRARAATTGLCARLPVRALARLLRHRLLRHDACGAHQHVRGAELARESASGGGPGQAACAAGGARGLCHPSRRNARGASRGRVYAVGDLCKKAKSLRQAAAAAHAQAAQHVAGGAHERCTLANIQVIHKA